MLSGAEPRATPLRKWTACLAVLLLALVILGRCRIRQQPTNTPKLETTTTSATRKESRGAEQEDASPTLQAPSYSGPWAEHKAKLCPGGIPAVHQHEGILFAKAAELLGLGNLSSSSIGATTSREDSAKAALRSRLGRWFYRLSQGGWVYEPKSSALRVAYLRHFKCASAQMDSYGSRQLKPQSSGFLSLPPGPAFRRALMTGSGSAPVSCALLVTRDPVEHFLSGYNEVETRLEAMRLNADPSGSSSSSGARQPHQTPSPDQLATLRRRLQELESSELRFPRLPLGSTARAAAFVEDLLLRAPAAPDWLVRDLLTHVFPQANALLQLSGRASSSSSTAAAAGASAAPPPRPTVAFASLEKLQTEVPRLLQSVCGLPAAAAPPMHRSRPHASARDPVGARKAASELFQASGPAAAALCALHSIDYACFADILPPPPLCAKIFSDSEFLNNRPGTSHR